MLPAAATTSKGVEMSMLTAPRLRFGASNLPRKAFTQSLARGKRHEAFDAGLDQEALQQAREWYKTFQESKLPKGNTTFARSSGPGGQHVNKTESKALTAYPVTDILQMLPQYLRPYVRSSKFYTTSNDSLAFQAQASRSRSANADENRTKLFEEITRIYRERVPAETNEAKKAKHRDIEKRFHDSRLKTKKMQSSKKASRRGPSD